MYGWCECTEHWEWCWSLDSSLHNRTKCYYKPGVRYIYIALILLLIMVKTIQAQCQRCDYDWETKSEMIMVSCPSCSSKVRIRDIVKLIRIRDDPNELKGGNQNNGKWKQTR